MLIHIKTHRTLRNNQIFFINFKRGLLSDTRFLEGCIKVPLSKKYKKLTFLLYFFQI
nr:MAG TPA: hypothetical protein [Caudoviricetes sp.]